jgi:hypothetical protein
MIIHAKGWTRCLQEAIDQTFPGKQLKVDESAKSLTGMIKDSQDRRGILNGGARQKEIREIIATLRASKELGDDLRLYVGALGGRQPTGRKKIVEQPKSAVRKPWKRRVTNFPQQVISLPLPDILEITRNHVLRSKDTPLARRLAWEKWKAPTATFVEGGNCSPK